MRGNPVHPEADDPVKPLHLVRLWLREALDQTDTKHEAVAAEIGVSPPYFSEMLAGTKPIAARHLWALPEAVAAHIARRWAEYHGHIVVVPAHSVDQAVRHLVSGLVALLSPHQLRRAS